MISELRLSQIIATMTELSEEKKKDLYKFLIDLKNQGGSIDPAIIQRILRDIANINTTLGKKVDKVTGKGLSSNDFTNELRTKLVNLVGNVQANWNQTDPTKPDYIVNKPEDPDLSDYELKSNKVISINAQSTDDEYPTAKCVYTIVGDIESVLNNILGV